MIHSFWRTAETYAEKRSGMRRREQTMSALQAGSRPGSVKSSSFSAVFGRPAGGWIPDARKVFGMLPPPSCRRLCGTHHKAECLQLLLKTVIVSEATMRFSGSSMHPPDSVRISIVLRRLFHDTVKSIITQIQWGDKCFERFSNKKKSEHPAKSGQKRKKRHGMRSSSRARTDVFCEKYRSLRSDSGSYGNFLGFSAASRLSAICPACTGSRPDS